VQERESDLGAAGVKHQKLANIDIFQKFDKLVLVCQNKLDATYTEVCNDYDTFTNIILSASYLSCENH